jgi:hypothetical protein
MMVDMGIPYKFNTYHISERHSYKSNPCQNRKYHERVNKVGLRALVNFEYDIQRKNNYKRTSA